MWSSHGRWTCNEQHDNGSKLLQNIKKYPHTHLEQHQHKENSIQADFPLSGNVDLYFINSLMTDKPEALGFQIEWISVSVG